ncbi:MAG: glycine--tRNA ligase subunit beta [Holophagales bacterium]|nr:glycine--tRNA ligase subunit beta [Holophagales bacterium]
MPELLLEVRSQELPAELLETYLERLASRVFEELMSRGIAFEEMLTGATPRRLALCVLGLPDRTPERQRQELGPPAAEARDADGEPTEALSRFAERVGQPLESLEVVRTEKGEYVAAGLVEPGLPMAGVATELIRRHLEELLRPGDRAAGSSRWPRPVTGLILLLDGEVLDGRHLDSSPVPEQADGDGVGEVEGAGDPATGPDGWTFEGHAPSARSVGHPWLSPEPFAVHGWRSYLESLESRGILLPVAERRRALADAVAAEATRLGGEALIRNRLLALSAASVEIPGVVGGAFDPRFLDLPSELVITALAERQQAFAVCAPAGAGGEPGELMPRFVAAVERPTRITSSPPAASGDAGDGQPGVDTGSLRRGWERSVAGTLADLGFFVEADRARPLAERVRRLEQMSFHPRLGTFADKGQRRRSLVEVVAGQLGWHEQLEPALEASLLLEADLATAVVEVFPSLRGVAGGVYARQEGYVEAVWRAVYDRDRPTTAKGPIPRGRVGRMVAVADRLATLVGFFGLGAQPTARSDPHGLRPAAFGLLRIVVEGEMALDLDLLAARAALLFGDRLERPAEELLHDLQAFLADRLDHLLGRRGYAHDEIQAAKAVGVADLPDLVARIEALRAVRGAPGFRSLVLAARRISNIVRDAPAVEIDPGLLELEPELELHRRIVEVSARVETSAAERDYVGVLRQLLELVPALDRFFAEVLVMDEDERLRTNRIALLHACRRLYWRVGRLKEVEPGAEPEPRPSAEPGEDSAQDPGIPQGTPGASAEPDDSADAAAADAETET